MPRSPACRNCADKKVGCKPNPGRTVCERCAEKGLLCEWPYPGSFLPFGFATKRTACDRCRFKRIKCEMQPDQPPAVAAAQCAPCALNGAVCAIRGVDVTSGTPLLQDVAHAPLNGPPSQAHPSQTVNTAPTTTNDRDSQTAGAAPVNRHRGWWDVVLAPSPPPAQ